LTAVTWNRRSSRIEISLSFLSHEVDRCCLSPIRGTEFTFKLEY
jgi:hypothetical protein